jgi:indolepyruvate ferredoxin oxidoreductase beta subunit
MMKKNVKNILMSGVGGQGILRASDIVSMVAMESGLDVKKSEVHGMAQRGGCVTSHVRYGQKVYSPIARKGDVDILVSFEKLETLRYMDYLKPEGLVIINEREICPPSVNLGISDYPHDIAGTVSSIFSAVRVVDAGRLAKEAGDVRAENTILLGVLSAYLRLEVPLWLKVICESFPPKFVETNLEAFHLGRASQEQASQ